MKVLLFTHKNDIDGMGSAVLAKLAYDEVDYILCETFEIDELVTEKYDSKEIYQYDKIFVTDLFLKEELLDRINNDKELKSKFLIFDHHKTYLEISKNYPFTNLKIKDEKGKCCATTIFYDYLVDKSLIDESDPKIYEFCEKTRRHDTWEWIDKYNDEVSHDLALLFDSVSCDGYIELMLNKLKNHELRNFIFTDFETQLIKNKRMKIKEKLEYYLNNIHYRTILEKKAAIIFIEYEYRNELAEYLRKLDLDIDFVMMISIDRGTVSYRSIKEGINVREVAEAFNGKGHDKAATNKIEKEIVVKLINDLIKVKKIKK